MGIDLVRLANHAMPFTNAAEMLSQIEAKTGLPVWVSVEENGSWPKPPQAFRGWIVHVEEGKTLQSHLDSRDVMMFVRTNKKGEEEHFELSPFLIDYYSEAFYMGRWSQVKYFADAIRQHGLPPPGHYHEHPAGWQLQQRQNYYEYHKQFGTTASILFCDDLHEEWLEYCYEEHWTLEQFVAWGKRDLLFVRFADLIDFNFPEKTPDSYNIFIYDEFADLEA